MDFEISPIFLTIWMKKVIKGLKNSKFLTSSYFIVLSNCLKIFMKVVFMLDA